MIERECQTCRMEHAICGDCGEPVAYSERWARSFDAHASTAHACAGAVDLAEWARAEVQDGYLALREPTVAEAASIKEDPPAKTEPTRTAPQPKPAAQPKPIGVEVFRP